MLLSSCASFPENTLGENGNPIPGNGLEISLKPANGTRIVVPEPIHFDIILLNTGTEPIHLPPAPYLSLVWTFPNGVRDGKVAPDNNEILEDPTAVLRLEPGTTATFRETVQTAHYPNLRWGMGIIAFRAGYRSDLNPRSSTAGLWQGAACSSLYGVEVLHGGKSSR